MSNDIDTQDIRMICTYCDLKIPKGHAYELEENKWHINSFKCSKRDILLGCNSDLFTLGNGDLICSSCRYICMKCDTKIDGIVILTDDEPYCSNCFRCDHWKQSIESLRYARTMSSLFCMNCYQDILATKKKFDVSKRQLAKRQLSAFKSL